VRVFITSANPTLRLALLMLLDGEPGIVVSGMSDRSEGLLNSIGSSQPEVLLLDCRLAIEATADLIGQLLYLQCPPKIIVLSTNPRARESALAAGADGFISENAPPDELLPILRSMRSSDAAT
jgi:DNA-binding NarL/FixJ family response regulator